MVPLASQSSSGNDVPQLIVTLDSTSSNNVESSSHAEGVASLVRIVRQENSSNPPVAVGAVFVESSHIEQLSPATSYPLNGLNPSSASTGIAAHPGYSTSLPYQITAAVEAPASNLPSIQSMEPASNTNGRIECLLEQIDRIHASLATIDREIVSCGQWYKPHFLCNGTTKERLGKAIGLSIDLTGPYAATFCSSTALAAIGASGTGFLGFVMIFGCENLRVERLSQERRDLNEQLTGLYREIDLEMRTNPEVGYHPRILRLLTILPLGSIVHRTSPPGPPASTMNS